VNEFRSLILEIKEQTTAQYVPGSGLWNQFSLWRRS